MLKALFIVWLIGVIYYTAKTIWNLTKPDFTKTYMDRAKAEVGKEMGWLLFAIVLILEIALWPIGVIIKLCN